MLNRFECIGNVGREPEIRMTANGKPVASFSVAVNSKRGSEEHTEWVHVVAWDKLADICNAYLTKGRQVYIAGRLQTRQYQKNGTDHYRTEVIASDMQMLGAKEHKATPHEQQKANGYQPENDIPF